LEDGRSVCEMEQAMTRKTRRKIDAGLKANRLGGPA
jgi:hypothetical protein